MPRTTPVSEVMTTDVLTFSPDDPVQEAMRALVDRGVDAAPVVNGIGEVVGMLSASDLIVQDAKLHVPTVISLFGAYLELPSSKNRFHEDIQKALGGLVSDVMHPDPVSIAPEDTLEDAATLMHEQDVSRLPVIADEGLVGIIARADILRSIIRDQVADEPEATPAG